MTFLVAALVFLVVGVARGSRPHRPRRLGRLPLPAKQGGCAFVRGVVCRCGPAAGRGHPLSLGVLGPRLRVRT
jgi:hypothetical protein